METRLTANQNSSERCAHLQYTELKRVEPRLTANRNSGERCVLCRHAQTFSVKLWYELSDKIMSLYLSYHIPEETFLERGRGASWPQNCSVRFLFLFSYKALQRKHAALTVSWLTSELCHLIETNRLTTHSGYTKYDGQIVLNKMPWCTGINPSCAIKEDRSSLYTFNFSKKSVQWVTYFMYLFTHSFIHSFIYSRTQTKSKTNTF